MVLVDTDVLIDIQRGHAAAMAWFTSLTELPAASGFVVMELIQAARNSAEVRKAQKFAAPLRIIWPTEADYRLDLSNFASFHRSHGLGLLDSLIAATAIGQSAILCTFNEKHYRAVPGLKLSQPYPR